MTSGKPSDGEDMEHRVAALEKAFEKMDAKLDRILEVLTDFRVSVEKRFGEVEKRFGDVEKRFGDVERRFGDVEHRAEQRFSAMNERAEQRYGALTERLASIEGKLETKASATELARVAGRVESLPTTWQMITLVFGILGGAFLILKFGLPHAP